MRDKFLTEAMGECWHENIFSPGGGYCGKCQESHSKMRPLPNNNFSTWEGFGKLWEWAQEQEWWGNLDFYIFHFNEYYPDIEDFQELIHPDRFADAVYKFLKDQQ